MKNLLLLSFFLYGISFQSSAQSGKLPVLNSNNLRVASNTVPKAMKSYTFKGSDSTDLVYSYTSFFEFDSLGRQIKTIYIDTLKNQYLLTNIIAYDELNRYTLYADVDTVKKDTSFSSFVATYPSKGIQVITYKDYKRVSIDSSGILIIDSSFVKENNQWRFQQVQRDYYTYKGKNVIAFVSSVANSTSPLKPLLRHINYKYQDTLLLSYEIERFNQETNQWENGGSFIMDYIDEYGSKRSTMYDAQGDLISFQQLTFDSRGDMVKELTPNVYVLNKYNQFHNLRQTDFHSTDTVSKTSSHIRVLYDDFKTVGVTAVEGSLLKEEKILLFPNPISTRLNIELIDQTIKIKTLTVKNSLGQTVYTSEGHERSINLDPMSVGFYHVEIATDQGMVHKTIVKE